MDDSPSEDALLAAASDISEATVLRIIEDDKDLVALKALLLNTAVPDTIRMRMVLNSKFADVLQKWTVEKILHTEDMQVQLARHGSKLGRQLLARCRQPLTPAAQRELLKRASERGVTFEISTRLAQRHDLAPDVSLALSLSGKHAIGNWLFRNPSLIDSINLSFAHYQQFDTAGLERIRVGLGADEETWHGIGPSWTSSLDLLAEACKLTLV